MFVEFILCSRDNLDAGPRLPDVDDDLGFVGQGREPLTLDVLGVAAATSGGPVPGPRALQDGLNLLIRTNKIMSQKSLCWDVVKFSADKWTSYPDDKWTCYDNPPTGYIVNIGHVLTAYPVSYAFWCSSGSDAPMAHTDANSPITIGRSSS